eukprot:scaffold164398_cov30-Prasinocladus_malaysianus.AAC.1
MHSSEFHEKAGGTPTKRRCSVRGGANRSTQKTETQHGAARETQRHCSCLQTIAHLQLESESKSLRIPKPSHLFQKDVTFSCVVMAGLVGWWSGLLACVFLARVASAASNELACGFHSFRRVAVMSPSPRTA